MPQVRARSSDDGPVRQVCGGKRGLRSSREFLAETSRAHKPVIAEVTLQTSILRIAQIGAGRKQNP